MESRDSIQDVWGPRTPHAKGGAWPVREDLRVRDGRIVGVRGRANDRVNHGRLGPKGLHGWEANNAADRLTTPLIRRDGKLVGADGARVRRPVAHRDRGRSLAGSASGHRLLNVETTRRRA